MRTTKQYTVEVTADLTAAYKVLADSEEEAIGKALAKFDRDTDDFVTRSGSEKNLYLQSSDIIDVTEVDCV